MNELYQKIGVPLQLWVKQRYGSQKECCRLLHIKPSYLSMVIKGVRKANRDMILSLKTAGFNVDLFHHYLKIDTLPKSEKLTIQEIEFVVKGLKDLIGQKDIIIEGLQWEVKNLKNIIIDLRDEIHKLKKPVNSQLSK